MNDLFWQMHVTTNHLNVTIASVAAHAQRRYCMNDFGPKNYQNNFFSLDLLILKQHDAVH